jgi:hypothetical protein
MKSVMETPPDERESKSAPANADAAAKADAAKAEADAAKADAAAKPERGVAPPRTGKVRRALPWAIVAIATAAAIVFALLWRNSASELSAAQGVEHRRAGVVASGTDFLNALTNFSGNTIDADVERIRSFAVGDFAQQVEQFFGPSNVKALQRADVRSVGHVRSVFVQSIDGAEASVFGVVDEAITNAHSAPRTETLRIDIEMLETSGGWKVSRVDILQSPGGGPLG